MDSHLWTTIFDNLEHPERIQLGVIYPLYHHRWAERQAKYLLAHTNYLAHHTVETLTQVLLSAKIKIEQDCASSEEHRDIVPPVCSVLFLNNGPHLLLFDERMRLWIDGKLTLEDIRKCRLTQPQDTGDNLAWLVDGVGQLFGYYEDGKLGPIILSSAKPVTHLTPPWVIQDRMLLNCWYPAYRAHPVSPGFKLLEHVNSDEFCNNIFLIREEQDAYLVLWSETEEIDRVSVGPVKRIVDSWSMRTCAHLDDNSIIVIDHEIKGWPERKLKVTITALSLTGQLLPAAMRLIAYHNGGYYAIWNSWDNEATHMKPLSQTVARKSDWIQFKYPTNYLVKLSPGPYVIQIV